ncbi:hypothetical protein A3742_15570 [Oleiphilus sp. HI0071]|nr:hypothetical protein A3737_07080 [Oleiphilus sp. HI0065]KZY78761.1 hypothetical protein A3742_22655 [Oleiphilus sp. HI0071]KZY90008.1 hypothetical protein A3742_15570 [Oleiphilus sp. HI0071]KZZ16055.1 hypothetical protein A3751_15940 [Oleiphilus sp. HI0080]
MEEMASLALMTKAKRVDGGFEFREDKLHEEYRKVHKSCRRLFDAEGMKVEDVVKVCDDGAIEIRFEVSSQAPDMFDDGLIYDSKRKEIESLIRNSDEIHNFVKKQDKEGLADLRSKLGDEDYDKSCTFKQLRERQSSNLSFRVGDHRVVVPELTPQNDVVDEGTARTFVTRIHSFVLETLHLNMTVDEIGRVKLKFTPEQDDKVMSVFRKKPLRITAMLALSMTNNSKSKVTQGELIDIEVVEQEALPF